jgi:amidase
MTRTVRDAAILLGALAGIDAEDKVTAESQGHRVDDYTKNLAVDGLKDTKIGVARNYFGSHEAADAIITGALDVMKRQGATLIDTSDLPTSDKFGEAARNVLMYEMNEGVNAYLARLGPNAPVRTVQDVIAFNKKHADKELQYFGQDFFEKLAEKGPLTSYEYIESLAKCRRLSRTEGIDAVFDKLKLDAVVGPCGGPAWVTDLICGDRFAGNGDLISVAAIAGYPSITVPAGFLFGLPVGICFIGRAWSEPTLFKLAYSFEQAAKVRKPPQFLSTAELGARQPGH